MAKFGIVEYFGGDDGHRCGYCKSPSGFVSHGMQAHQLTVQNYQDLTDRGWRRSGKYCYKPTMDKMCCPLYIVRCDAPRFEISKSQKKVIKRLHKYLLTGEKRASASTAPAEKSSATSPTDAAPEPRTGSTRTKKLPTPGVGPDPGKPPCRKAKEIRKERRKLKLQLQLGEKSQTLTSTPTGESSASGQETSNQPSSEGDQAEIVGTLVDIPPGVTAVTSGFERTGCKDGKKSLEDLLMLPSAGDPLCHKLEIRLVQSHPKSAEFAERYNESYALYCKYQIAVHKDPPSKCSERRFTRFLLDSPLVPEPGPKEWECGYGSYHQWYILDGKLIMVGVVDILPKCLSSKYVFYDPDHDFLNLGVLSALTEIALVRRLHTHHSTLQYYCMGYYVHDCQKMNYKGQYFPSFLLCPETYRYIPIEKCRPKLDVSKYSRLCDEQEEEAQFHSSVDSYLNSLVLFQHQAMPYQVLRAIHGSRSEPKVKEYSSLVGPAVASQCLLFVE